MPKKIDHDQRKREILRAALELFSTKGYDATTLADIAKAVKIARPSLYHYFRNKNQILFFASKQFTDGFITSYQLIAQNQDHKPMARVCFILCHIVQSCYESRRELLSLAAFILKLEQEGHSVSDLIHRRTRQLKQLLEQVVVEAIDRKELFQLGAEQVVEIFLAAVSSSLVHVLLFPNESIEPVLKQIRTLVSLVAQGEGQPLLPNWSEEAYLEMQQHFLAQIDLEKNPGKARQEDELKAEWRELNPFQD